MTFNSNKTINVFVNYHIHSSNISNTDFSYAKNFKILENEKISIFYNKSYISTFLIDFIRKIFNSRIKKIIPLFLQKRLRKIAKHSIIFPWQLRNVDIVISHYLIPILLSSKKIPVVLSAGFMPNEYVGAKSNQERLEDLDWLKYKFSKATIVTFAAQCQIEHLKSLDNDNSIVNKVTFLPRLLPSIKPITFDRLSNKFNDARYNNKIKISFIGTDGIRKGLLEFMEALEIINSHDPKLSKMLQVTIVSKSEIKSMNNIEIIHYDFVSRDKVQMIMDESHIFCLPTHKDSYGFVFIEAMASGCAIIADNREPRTEFLQGGDCGLLVSNSSMEIATKLEKLVLNLDYAEQLASKALDRFNRVYSTERVKSGYLKLVHDLVS